MLETLSIEKSSEIYRQLTTAAERHDVPYIVRRMMLDAADHIASFSGLFKKPLPTIRVNLAPDLDPAFEIWARSLDNWATSPDGMAELEAMEARMEADFYAREAYYSSVEWDGITKF